MSKAPHVFSSLEELHKSLTSEATQRRVNEFFEQRASSIETIVHKSVAGNTYRAFHFKSFDVEGRPSSLFREWTSSYLIKNLSSVKSLNSFSEMVDFVCVMARELDNHWHQKTNRVDKVRIGFGRAAKLLGLALKHLGRLDSISNDQRKNLIAVLNVPLDSYTLQGIRLIAKDKNIPASATMNFVQSEDQYRELQLCIKELMPAGIHPIYYEVYAWNVAHP